MKSIHASPWSTNPVPRGISLPPQWGKRSSPEWAHHTKPRAYFVPGLTLCEVAPNNASTHLWKNFTTAAPQRRLRPSTCASPSMRKKKKIYKKHKSDFSLSARRVLAPIQWQFRKSHSQRDGPAARMSDGWSSLYFSPPHLDEQSSRLRPEQTLSPLTHSSLCLQRSSWTAAANQSRRMSRGGRGRSSLYPNHGWRMTPNSIVWRWGCSYVHSFTRLSLCLHLQKWTSCIIVSFKDWILLLFNISPW